VSLDGEFHDVQAGDFIYVPEKVFHGFETLDEPCEFYSIQSPPIYPVGEPADITFSNPGA
jgi:mannose-6-phosphate isomerase-like protein (cupin superfamily)